MIPSVSLSLCLCYICLSYDYDVITLMFWLMEFEFQAIVLLVDGHGFLWVGEGDFSLGWSGTEVGVFKDGTGLEDGQNSRVG